MPLSSATASFAIPPAFAPNTDRGNRHELWYLVDRVFPNPFSREYSVRYHRQIGSNILSSQAKACRRPLGDN